jgi:hypothetical protein
MELGVTEEELEEAHKKPRKGRKQREATLSRLRFQRVAEMREKFAASSDVHFPKRLWRQNTDPWKTQIHTRRLYYTDVLETCNRLLKLSSIILSFALSRCQRMFDKTDYV